MRIPALNHMMQHTDALADAFEEILGYSGSHGALVLDGLYTAAYIYAYAGVSDGVTPGVLDRATGTTAGAYGVDFGIIPGNGSTQADKSGFTPINVTDEDGIKLATGFTVTGSGSLADPYTIDAALLYAPGAAAPHLTWNDPDATYHIKLTNLALLQPSANFNLIDVVDSGAGTLLIEDSNLGGLGNSTAGYALVKVTAGTVRVRRSYINRAIGYCFWTAGPTADLTVEDSQADPSSGPAGWNGGFGSAAIFYNTGDGAKITYSGLTIDHQQAGRLLEIAADCVVNGTLVDYNPSNSALPAGIVNTIDSVMLAAWTSGFSFTESIVRAGPTAIPMWGCPNSTDAQSYKNWHVRHCDFIATTGHLTGSRFMSLGKNGNTTPNYCDNVLVEWCRYSRPDTEAAAGEECLEMFGGDNFEARYNWTDSCSEDAFEVVQPLSNNSVHHCGAGVPGVSVCAGNIVDFYGGGSVWGAAQGNRGGHSIHHIFGLCTADAWIVDSVHGVEVHHIDADNLNYGERSLDEPPHSNGRLHWRTASGDNLAGVVVYGPLSAVGKSFGGLPCALTYEDAAAQTYALANPGSVAWIDGISPAVKGGADGVVDAMAT